MISQVLKFSLIFFYKVDHHNVYRCLNRSNKYQLLNFNSYLQLYVYPTYILNISQVQLYLMAPVTSTFDP